MRTLADRFAAALGALALSLALIAGTVTVPGHYGKTPDPEQAHAAHAAAQEMI